VGALTIAVTGAAGFVGQAAVAEARLRGHRAVALQRRAGQAPAGWAADPGIAVVAGDLAQGGPRLEAALAGANAVIHAAAAMRGDAAAMARDTVAATAAVMSAAAPGTRIVLVGSLSVYAGRGVPPGGTLDEDSPRETRPWRRDAYTRAKIAQEDAARAIAAARGLPLWVIRAGAVYGPGHLWNAHLGPAFGPVLLCPGGGGQVPVIHVAHLARALVAAAERPPRGDGVVNAVEDDLPDRKAYLAALRAGPRLVLPLPWRLPDAAAAVLAPLGDRLPGLLRREVIGARLMPRRYANRRLHDWLGWSQELPFAAAMARSQEGEA
jgi:nucleoside-diphosphate-sugar epimerase